MRNMIKSFKELTPELQASAGGKGGRLAGMFQGSYPVPDGIVILPSAFQGENLNKQAWEEALISLNAMRKNNKGALFAVRSSALSEDSARASFAIEWAVAKGKLYLLQARPVTALTSGNLDTYEINESLSEDALWVNTNVGEAIPAVVGCGNATIRLRTGDRVIVDGGHGIVQILSN